MFLSVIISQSRANLRQLEQAAVAEMHNQQIYSIPLQTIDVNRSHPSHKSLIFVSDLRINTNGGNINYVKCNLKETAIDV